MKQSWIFLYDCRVGCWNKIMKSLSIQIAFTDQRFFQVALHEQGSFAELVYELTRNCSTTLEKARWEQCVSSWNTSFHLVGNVITVIHSVSPYMRVDRQAFSIYYTCMYFPNLLLQDYTFRLYPSLTCIYVL